MSANDNPSSQPEQKTAQLPPAFQGSLRLFRFAGVEVFIHWSWFLAAFYLIQDRPVLYTSMAWDVAEYLIVFGFVLMHEFGHVFACRSVGGTADRILLWPLGGLAFVAPPPRPGACLWTTFAGPLVNVFLGPILYVLMLATTPVEGEASSDFFKLFQTLFSFNVVMLVFNLLPVFPLDGGRILHALLWFPLGPGLSLAIAAGIGLIAAAGLLVFAGYHKLWWLAATAVFLMLGAFGSLKQARAIIAWSRIERRTDRACPHCRSSPPIGALWKCAQCNSQFDAFETLGACPNCKCHYTEIACMDCGKLVPVNDWDTKGLSDERDE
jgi:Zn-dependent protease